MRRERDYADKLLKTISRFRTRGRDSPKEQPHVILRLIVYPKHSEGLRRRDFLAGIAAALAPTGLSLGQHPPILAPGGGSVDPGSLARRKAYLEELLKILPHTRWPQGRINAIDKMWEHWVKRTGALPPDFETMPSIPGLPDPLTMIENGRGTPVQTIAQWRKQREWIKSQYQRWVIGRMPPPPDNLKSTVTAKWKEGEITVEDVHLQFGPEHKGFLHIQVMTPPGTGPFPVFVTNHTRFRPSSNVAVRRGYMACVYAAADVTYLKEDESNRWIEVYPDYDFGCIARWAWGAMRAVDYLYTLPRVDRKCIALSGHSRNAKQSLLAAAFDERITAVVPSRGNTSDSVPWRYATPYFTNESLEEITRGFSHWFHPNLRFFAGREHKLPVDQNMMMALVAPRALMVSHAYTEGQGNPFAVEQSYRSVRRVYRFLGREDRLWMYMQPGPHGAAPEDIEKYFDFFDSVFGRKPRPRREDWVIGYTFDNWKRISRDTINPFRFPRRKPGDFLPLRDPSPQGWAGVKSEIQTKIHWLLGKEPAGVGYPIRKTTDVPSYQSPSSSTGYLTNLLQRPQIEGIQSTVLSFGDDVRGDLYYRINPEWSKLTAAAQTQPERAPSQPPQGQAAPSQPPQAQSASSQRRSSNRPPAGVKLPLVIWLHPYSYATGYPQRLIFLLRSLTRRGFAVLGFDQLGFGTRVEMAKNFYERFPQWSLLGRMVADTRSALDAATSREFIDSSKIYLLGYSLGAKIALLTAALDERVTGVVSCCGFAPLRLSTADKGTEGLKHYSHLHGLIPRLGFFVGNESRLPVDYDEILAAIAPRPVHVLAPTLDRLNPVDDVRRSVEAAREVYGQLGGEGRLELSTPLGFNDFLVQWNWQPQMVNWLGEQAGLPPPPPEEKKRRTEAPRP